MPSFEILGPYVVLLPMTGKYDFQHRRQHPTTFLTNRILSHMTLQVHVIFLLKKCVLYILLCIIIYVCIYIYSYTFKKNMTRLTYDSPHVCCYITVHMTSQTSERVPNCSGNSRCPYLTNSTYLE